MYFVGKPAHQLGSRGKQMNGGLFEHDDILPLLNLRINDLQGIEAETENVGTVESLRTGPEHLGLGHQSAVAGQGAGPEHRGARRPFCVPQNLAHELPALGVGLPCQVQTQFMIGDDHPWVGRNLERVPGGRKRGPAHRRRRRGPALGRGLLRYLLGLLLTLMVRRLLNLIMNRGLRLPRNRLWLLGHSMFLLRFTLPPLRVQHKLQAQVVPGPQVHGDV